MQHQPPLGGFVLNRLMDALEHPDNQGSKGAGRVFFSSWTDRDQDAWLKWVFETQNDLGLGKLREAASEDSNKVDKLFKILKRAAKPLRATPEWCWAHFKTAMLHRSLCNDDKKAKQIIGSLLTGKDSRHSQQILFDARLMLSDILYEELRRIESLGSKSWPELISEMEKIPKLDQTWENSVLKNSLVSVNLARMYRIHGDLAKYKAMLEETFQSCVQGLRDDQAANGVANLRLLAKVLSFFEVLKDDAQIAISLQFSYLNSSIPGVLYERDVELFGESIREQYSSAWIYCNCGKAFPHWGETKITPLYACLTCADTDLCEECFDIRRKSAKSNVFHHWRYYCPQDHKYLKGPIDGWQGVQDGKIRIKKWEQGIDFGDWLTEVEGKWNKAWKNFRLDEPFVRDIM